MLSIIGSTKLCLNMRASVRMSVRCSEEKRMLSTFLPFRMVMMYSFGTWGQTMKYKKDHSSYHNANKATILFVQNKKYTVLIQSSATQLLQWHIYKSNFGLQYNLPLRIWIFSPQQFKQLTISIDTQHQPSKITNEKYKKLELHILLINVWPSSHYFHITMNQFPNHSEKLSQLACPTPLRAGVMLMKSW